MPELEPSTLQAALDAYKSHILSRNKTSLENYVRLISSCPPPADSDSEDEKMIVKFPERARRIRLQSLCNMLYIDPPILDAHMSSGIWAGEDDRTFDFNDEDVNVVIKYFRFMDRRLAGLDGVLWVTERRRWKGFRDAVQAEITGGGSLVGEREHESTVTATGRVLRGDRNRNGSRSDSAEESEDRAEARREGRKDWMENYFQAIQDRLRETCLVKLRRSISIPEDLKELAALGVDGLNGPGLGIFKHRYRYGVRLWRGFEDCQAIDPKDLENVDSYRPVAAKFVKSAQTEELDKFAGMDNDEWVVGGGWHMGGAKNVRICAVYAARRRGRPDTGAGSPGVDEFEWRFVVRERDSEGGPVVFDQLKSLIYWGRKYREDRFLVDADEIRASVKDEDIWMGLW